jgi:hypothetical protein
MEAFWRSQSFNNQRSDSDAVLCFYFGLLDVQDSFYTSDKGCHLRRNPIHIHDHSVHKCLPIEQSYTMLDSFSPIVRIKIVPLFFLCCEIIVVVYCKTVSANAGFNGVGVSGEQYKMRSWVNEPMPRNPQVECRPRVGILHLNLTFSGVHVVHPEINN